VEEIKRKKYKEIENSPIHDREYMNKIIRREEEALEFLNDAMLTKKASKQLNLEIEIEKQVEDVYEKMGIKHEPIQWIQRGGIEQFGKMVERHYKKNKLQDP